MRIVEKDCGLKSNYGREGEVKAAAVIVYNNGYLSSRLTHSVP